MALPNRKQNRLKNYDYNQSGAYFITICTHNKANIFGEIINDTLHLTEFGLIVEKHIQKMNTLYDEIVIDKYVIMPNHIHLIITNYKQNDIVPTNDRTKSTLSKMIQVFKSSVTKELGTHTMRSLQVPVWQKSFYDHIIRNEKEYQEIWEYIDTNPLKWRLDCYYK